MADNPHPYIWEAELHNKRVVRKSEWMTDVGKLGATVKKVRLIPQLPGWPGVELHLNHGESASVFRTQERDINGPLAGVERTVAVGLAAVRDGQRLNVIWCRHGQPAKQAPTYEALLQTEGVR